MMPQLYYYYYTFILLLSFLIFDNAKSFLFGTGRGKHRVVVDFDGGIGQPHQENNLYCRHRDIIPKQKPSATHYHYYHHYYTSRSALYCQLLGMNCATPTDFEFSLRGFCKRGGETDVHADGWGIAFYQDCGLRQFHDVLAASTSPMAQFLADYPVQTLNMLAHIRYATVGKVDLSNVHPFTREMWGIQWCFAHNGDVPLFKQQQQQGQKFQQSTAEASSTLSSLSVLPKLGQKSSTSLSSSTTKDNDNNNNIISFYHPVGTTDSEAVFCSILNALRSKFQTIPSLPVLYDTLQELCNEIVSYDPQSTILNFVMSCGPHTLWAYSWPGSRPGSKVWNGLYYTIREYPFTKCHLADADLTVDFSTVTSKEDCVSVIATAPLTDNEKWIEFQKGELILFDQGRPHVTPNELFQVELLGHGLISKALQPPQLQEDMRLYHYEPDHFQGGGI